MAFRPNESICIGKISGAFGVKGWIKITSYTDSIENILDYTPWVLKRGDDVRICKPVEGKLQSNNVIARMEGSSSRDQAEIMRGFEIWIAKNQLPETREGEYYWIDLIGLKVINLAGEQLGTVDSLMETGANDVLIVRGLREHALPFLQGQTVLNVDVEAGVVTVDWDPNF